MRPKRQSREVRFFNPTLEQLEIQCNSQGFVFPARCESLVPEQLADHVYNDWGHRGIFEVYGGIDFKEEQRKALIRYLTESLDVRIQNHVAHMDMMKSMGKTIEEPFGLKQAKKWREEVYNILNIQAPVQADPSFSEIEDINEFAGLSNATIEKKEVGNTPRVIVRRGRAAAASAPKSFTEIQAEV